MARYAELRGEHHTRAIEEDASPKPHHKAAVRYAVESPKRHAGRAMYMFTSTTTAARMLRTMRLALQAALVAKPEVKRRLVLPVPNTPAADSGRKRKR